MSFVCHRKPGEQSELSWFLYLLLHILLPVQSRKPLNVCAID